MQNKMKIQQARLNKIVSRLNGPVAVVLEGRDTAGKSGTIREVTHYLPTDSFSVCLSTMPSKTTMKKWLPFWRRKMPTRPMLTFFDRSWYSRALVQPLNGWCSAVEPSRSDRTVHRIFAMVAMVTRVGRDKTISLYHRRPSPCTIVILSPLRQSAVPA